MSAVYATTTDLANMLPPSLIAKATSAQQAAALAYASDTVTDYLTAHFTMPIQQPYTQSMVLRTAQIAAYQLMLMIGFNPSAGPNTNVRQMYLDAIEWCTGVASGAIPTAIVDSAPATGEEGPLLLTDQSRQIEDPYISNRGTYTTLPGPIWGPG